MVIIKSILSPHKFRLMGETHVKNHNIACRLCSLMLMKQALPRHLGRGLRGLEEWEGEQSERMASCRTVWGCGALGAGLGPTPSMAMCSLIQ